MYLYNSYYVSMIPKTKNTVYVESKKVYIKIT